MGLVVGYFDREAGAGRESATAGAHLVSLGWSATREKGGRTMHVRILFSIFVCLGAQHRVKQRVERGIYTS